MRAWNRKHKPKHWTKPRWEIEILGITNSKICRLISRGIKNKYKFDDIFEWVFSDINNKPEFKVLSVNSCGLILEYITV